jgi:Cytochrome c554 and c-prime
VAWSAKAFSDRSLIWLLVFSLFLAAPISSRTAQSQNSRASDNLPDPAVSRADTDKDKQPPPRRAYAGDAACRSCHEQETKSYSETAHHLTSRTPNAHSILGKFSPGANILRTSNPYLLFEMSANKDGYFESAVEQPSPSETLTHTERIDVVIGSGRKGQTYLFWKGDKLFELPVSYWKELDAWINSPGYPDGSPHFDKPVVPRCLECHSGYFEAVPQTLNRFSRASLVLGITCERCHGPGRDHVLLHSSKTLLHGTAEAIVNPGALSRDRQMDVCASCHSGAGKPLAPALSFVPGKMLDDYLYVPYVPDDSVDVHGNQVQLLTSSRCFRNSTMTCITCHDVHKPQREAAGFSQHCLTCHKAEDCGRFPMLGARIASNCVDCHMPLEESETLVSDTNRRKIKPRVRNHRIGIYPDAAVP